MMPIGLKEHITNWMKAHLLNDKSGKDVHACIVLKDTTKDNNEAWRDIPIKIDVAFERLFCSPNVIPEIWEY